MSAYRKPAVAGLFYPSGYWKLKDEINRLLESTGSSDKYENIFGLISPHAGYLYSGKTAAFAFNQILNKKYKNIFIISPSHREYFPGICIYSGEGYETPLGKVPVNLEIAAKLCQDSKVIYLGNDGHKDEHAVEVQLPFLQYVLEDFSIIPIVMGDQSKMFVDSLAEQLSRVVDKDSLIIASSDLSHYHSRKEAMQLDSVIADRINAFDFENLQKDLRQKRCEACGGGPVVSLMKTASLVNKEKSIVLHRSDSGDVTGDLSEVVGYLSALIYGE